MDAGDHQPAQLIQTRAPAPGDDVVGAGESSASDRAIALTWPMAPRAVDDAQESPAVDDVEPEH